MSGTSISSTSRDVAKAKILELDWYSGRGERESRMTINNKANTMY